MKMKSSLPISLLLLAATLALDKVANASFVSPNVGVDSNNFHLLETDKLFLSQDDLDLAGNENETRALQYSPSTCGDDDNLFFDLLIRNPSQTVQCSWLQNQPRRIIRYNCENDDIATACPSTCGRCPDCPESEDAFAAYRPHRVTCPWIREDASRRDLLCQQNSPAVLMCGQTCGRCSRTYPPTPSPVDEGTTVCNSDYTVDFSTDGAQNPLGAGQYIDNNVQFNSVRFRAIRAQNLPDGDWEDAMIYDASNPTGADISYFSFGNMLIISEDGNSDYPNDNAGGGVIEARFDESVTVVSLKLFDTDRRGSRVIFYDERGSVLETLDVPRTPNGGYVYMRPHVENTRWMHVVFAGTGGLDEVEIWRPCSSSDTPVEAPTSEPPSAATCEDDDDRFFDLLVRNPSQPVQCSWLQNQPRRVLRYNCENDDIATACPRTCGRCPDCPESEDAFAAFRPHRVTCPWIREESNRSDLLCQQNSPALAMCRHTCGQCSQTDPPDTPPSDVCESDYIVDFSADGMQYALTAGQYIGNSVQFNSVSFRAIRAQNLPDGDWDDGMIYDAANPTGADISYPNFGNMMIISEDGDTDYPNDNAGGGVIEARFDEDVTVVSLKLFDTDRRGSQVIFYNVHGSVLETLDVPRAPNGGYVYMRPHVENTRWMHVVFSGTGGLDEVEIWRPCPSTNPPNPAPVTDVPTLAPVGQKAPPFATSSPTVCLSDSIIDFSTTGWGEPLTGGDIIDTDVYFNRATIKAVRRKALKKGGLWDDGMIFDTTNVSGGDVHLDHPQQGNVLIISQDGNSENPNDERKGGSIEIEFSYLTTVVSFKVIGTGKKRGKAEFLDADGKMIRRMKLPRMRVNGVFTISDYVEGVKTMIVHFKRTGALDDIELWHDCAQKGPPIGTADTSAPTRTPSFPPTRAPSFPPTSAPSYAPSRSPSEREKIPPPTDRPSFLPTDVPSPLPSATPTTEPTNTPTVITDVPTPQGEDPPTSAPVASTGAPITNTAFTSAPTTCLPDYIIDFSIDGTGQLMRKGDKLDDTVLFNAATFKGRSFDAPRGTFNDACVSYAGWPRGNVVTVTPKSEAGVIIGTFTREVTVVSLAVKCMSGNYDDVLLEFWGASNRLVRREDSFRFADDVIGARYIPYAEDVVRMRVTLGSPGCSLDEVDIWRHCTLAPTEGPTVSPTTAFPTLSPTTAPPTNLPTISLAPTNTPTSSTPKPTICAPDIVIGFSRTGEGRPLMDGDLINETVPFNGATFRARNDEGEYDDGMVFDSEFPNGLVLIVSENGIDSVAGAGEIIVDFVQEVNVVSVLIGGNTDNATSFEFWDGNGNPVDEGAEINFFLELGGIRYVPYAEDVIRMRITFAGPGKFLADVDIWRDCTFEPTSSPIVTSMPTIGPTTSSPTVVPTTASPTSAPTTRSPTSVPTTVSPTVTPTGEPTTCVTDFVIGFSRDGVNNPLFEGDRIDSSVRFNTVRFRARKEGDETGFDDGMLIDTGAPPAGTGLALIISENGNITHPVAAAGEIWADFVREVTVVSVLIANDSGSTLEFYDREGAIVQTVTQSRFVEPSGARYVPYAEDIVKMRVIFANPGSALDEVDIWRHCTDYPTPVPKAPRRITEAPTPQPTFEPTTGTPTLAPTSTEPTTRPTISIVPSAAPSSNPTEFPTHAPTVCDTDYVLGFTRTAYGATLYHGDAINDDVIFNAATFRARVAGNEGGEYGDAYIEDAGEPNGNVLVISEDGASLSRQAGEVVVTFSKPVTVKTVTIEDDQGDTVVQLYDKYDELVRSVSAPVYFDNTNTHYTMNEWRIARMTVTFGSPGAALAEVSLWRDCTDSPTEAPSP